MEDDWFIDFRPGCSVSIGSEFGEIEYILYNVSIRRKMLTGQDTCEFKLLILSRNNFTTVIHPQIDNH